MTPAEIKTLRQKLAMDMTEFSKLLNVDHRSISRWEKGDAKPTAACEGVMVGIIEALRKYPAHEAQFLELIRTANAVGGLAYLIVKLFEYV